MDETNVNKKDLLVSVGMLYADGFQYPINITVPSRSNLAGTQDEVRDMLCRVRLSEGTIF
jgi:hypothetical protein